MQDIHRLPVHFTTHAVLMLIERFELPLNEAKHYIKTARIVKAFEKDGNVGILQSNIGQTNIKFVCMVRDNALWVITVEECN